MARRLSLIIGLVVGLLTLPTAQADPISIAIASALAAVGVTVSASAITSAIVTAVITTAIGIGASALAGAFSKPKIPKADLGAFAADAGTRLNISRSAVDSHKVIYGRVRTSGTMVYIGTTDREGQKNGHLHMVIALAGHECEEIEHIYVNEDAVTLDGDGFVTDSRYTSASGITKYIRVRKHLGADDQTADTAMMEEIPNWTGQHRLRGITYIYVRLRYSADRFPNGVPNFSAIIKGKKLYDPRTTLTAWSQNPALCIRDYITSSDYGLGGTDAEIDDDTVIASANICDEDVTLADSSTQTRYTCNGVVDTANAPIEILKDLATAMAGVIPYSQGRFRCFAGAYSVPTVTIDESWLAGDLEIQARTSRGELFNAVTGVYVAPDKQWQPTDFPMVTNATYQAQDGGLRIIRDIELPFTLDPVEGQRIGKVALEKIRQGIVVKGPFNFKALQLAVWDTVQFNLDLTGWSGKVFRVAQWELSPDGWINLVLNEESAESYDWNSGEQTTYDTAPDTNLPDPNFVETPGNPVVTEELYATTDGSGVKTRAVLTWAESEDTFLARYAVQYKLSSATDWINFAGEVISNSCIISDIGPGAFDFRVRTVSGHGAVSDWVSTSKEFVGLTEPPAAVSGFTINAQGGQAHLLWTQASDLDVRIGGSVKLKHTSLLSGAFWENAQDIAPDLPGIATNAVVPLKSGTYFAKFYDSVGNESLSAASISVEVPEMSALTVIHTSNQHTSFPGAKSSMYVASDNTLRLDGGVLFDSISGDFDDASGPFDFGAGSGYATSGSYQFADGGLDYIDLKAVMHNRIEFNMLSEVVDAGTLFDDADGLWDDREGLFDGTDRSLVDVTFWVKTTSDDPAGTPTWSDWIKLNQIGEFTCRAYQRKIDVESAASSNNIVISELGTVVYTPTRDEKFNDAVIAAGGSTLTYATPFVGKPHFYLTVQGTSSGDTPKYTHVTSGGLYTGVTVQILNGGSGVGRTIDLTARSY